MTTQTLGLIGSGEIGSTLARLAVAAGLDVVLSNSRSPQTLAGLVAEIGGHARAATPADAARAGDLVMACLPLKAYGQPPAAALAGKPYLAAWRDGMSQEDAQHGFSETQGIPVSVDRVRELANMAHRG